MLESTCNITGQLRKLPRTIHRCEGQADVAYFNYILSNGWQVFLEQERQYLLKVDCNNTTNTYLCTGFFPLNPYMTAWIEAIEMLGLAGEHKMSSRSKLGTRSPSELGDVAVACIRGEEILRKWRLQLVEAVNEGEDIHEYARVLLPASMAATEVEQTALKIVKFQCVDVSKIALPGKKKKEEETHETTKCIVRSTHATDPIQISYLSNLDGNDSEEQYVECGRTEMAEGVSCQENNQ
jgi:hypothetical protein